MLLKLTAPLRLAAARPDPDDEERPGALPEEDGRADTPSVDDVDIPTEDDDDQGEADDEEQPRREDRARTVGGSIIEYGVRSHPSGPFSAVTFAPGSLRTEANLSRVKLLRDHDSGQPIGVLADLADSQAAADATFRLGRHQAATDALTLAEDGVLDGFSVGVEPLAWHEDADGRGVTITEAALREVSLVALPAYTNARATRVTATEGTPVNAFPPAAPVPAQPDPPERAPAHAAPLTAGLATGPAPYISAARYVDRQGYARTLPGLVVGRERIDACDYLAASLDLMIHGNGEQWARVKNILAAAGDQTSDLVPGLLPQIIVGPILDRIAAKRPVWLALADRTMPSLSNKFERLRITQHSAVGKQTAELADLTTQQFKVSMEDVTKDTYGGWANLSRQIQDWSSPGALAMIVEDLAANVVLQSEVRASADLVKVATPNKFEIAGMSGKDVNTGIYGAAAKVYLANPVDRVAPDRVFMDPAMWAAIGSASDDSGRPLFPAMDGRNALGSFTPADPTTGNFSGLRVVVGPYLPLNTLIVGASRAIEVYEDQRGMIQVQEPSVLGTQIAAYAYLATYTAQPKEMVSVIEKKP